MADGTKMYTGDDYLEKNPGYHLEDAGWKARLILEMMEKNLLTPSSVADIGCGAGGVIREMASRLPASVEFTGYDISENAIAMANRSASANARFICGNYFRLSSKAEDLVLVIDLLEHLDDYYQFLRELRQSAQRCIFHIPLDLSSRSVLKPHILEQQRKSVGHIHYFTLDMVLWFLRDTGFLVKDWRFTKPVTDIAASPSWFRGLKKHLRNISFGINPDLSAKLWGDYSVLIFAE